MADRRRTPAVCLLSILSLQVCYVEGVVHFTVGKNQPVFPPSSGSDDQPLRFPGGAGGSKAQLTCYYTPTTYFPATRVPSNVCTHVIYAFGALSASGAEPNIAPPSARDLSAWTTLTSLRRQNPDLKVMLSLQNGFPDVVGNNNTKMRMFAKNAVLYLRGHHLDGVDMDWEFPNSHQKAAYANFFTIMREAINHEARVSNRLPLLLSLALPNTYYSSERGYDVTTISSAVDFGMVMAYDFHLYTETDRLTGYNSPLFTPDGEFKYYSTAAMAQYFLSKGMDPNKFLLGLPTYGRSWQLAQTSSHGLHAPAVGKGPPGPYRHLTGVYEYPDACTALKQGATRVYNETLGAVYLYHGTTWVAYDDTTTISLKCQWAQSHGLAGVGVWAMHLDDIDGACGQGSLPLIRAMATSLGLH